MLRKVMISCLILFISMLYVNFAELMIENNYLERLLRAVIAIGASVLFSEKLKKFSELLLGSLLAIFSLVVSYSGIIVIVFYIFWSYSRWKQSLLLTDLRNDRDNDNPLKNNHVRELLVGIKVRYLYLWIIFAMMISFQWINEIGHDWFNNQDLLSSLFGSNLGDIIYYDLLLLWMVYQFEKYGVQFKQFFSAIAPKQNWLPIVLMVVFGTFFGWELNSLVVEVESFFFPTHVQELLDYNLLSSAKSESATILDIAFCGVSAAIIAPILEEFLFRGLILGRLAVKWNINKAILISSFLFGILHGDDGGLGAFIFAIMVSVIYIKTKSLILPIMIHMLTNTWAFAASWSSLYEEAATIQDIQSDIWLDILLSIISLVGFLYFLRKNWPKADSEVPLLSNELSNINITKVLQQ